jgi:hypothetical protein
VGRKMSFQHAIFVVHVREHMHVHACTGEVQWRIQGLKFGFGNVRIQIKINSLTHRGHAYKKSYKPKTS